MMIGVIVSAVLHGLCLIQAFYYFQRMSSRLNMFFPTPTISTGYKKDSWILKSLVSVIPFIFLHSSCQRSSAKIVSFRLCDHCHHSAALTQQVWDHSLPFVVTLGYSCVKRLLLLLRSQVIVMVIFDASHLCTITHTGMTVLESISSSGLKLLRQCTITRSRTSSKCFFRAGLPRHC